MINAMEKNKGDASFMTAIVFDRESLTFEVEDPYNHSTHQVGRKYKVELQAHRCDYGAFQAMHYPCVHAMAACLKSGWDFFHFVHRVFRLDTMRLAYSTTFKPLGDVVEWPPYDGPIVRPNPAKRRRKKGQPVEARIHNEMDERERGPPTKCTICRTAGHNKKNCPHRRRNL